MDTIKIIKHYTNADHIKSNILALNEHRVDKELLDFIFTKYQERIDDLLNNIIVIKNDYEFNTNSNSNPFIKNEQ